MTRPATPIAFTDEELDALLLGLAMIAPREEAGEDDEAEAAEDSLAAAVDSARARIAAALPPEPPYRATKAHTAQQRVILGAIAAETRLTLAHRDGRGAATERIVWPIDLAGDMLVAWCERRQDFRHFRTDRIQDIAATGRSMPVRRRVLRAAQRARGEEAGW